MYVLYPLRLGSLVGTGRPNYENALRLNKSSKLYPKLSVESHFIVFELRYRGSYLVSVHLNSSIFGRSSKLAGCNLIMNESPNFDVDSCLSPCMIMYLKLLKAFGITTEI